MDKDLKLNKEATWPPKPNVPVAHGGHDEYLTSVLFTPKTLRPVSREDLQNALRRSAKLDQKQSRLAVSDYCDR